MRTNIPLLSIVTMALVVCGATQFQEPQGEPRLHIKSVTSPVSRPESLLATLEVFVIGATPVALSQDQFALELFQFHTVDVYTEALFGTNCPPIITLQPGTTNTIVLGLSTNDVKFLSTWKALKPGTYTLIVHVGSGRRRHFDYQFMGQRHSNKYEFDIR